MKLLCINNKDINIDGRLHWGGRELKEGEIYTTKGKPFMSVNKQMCYYIDGFGSKMCCRFTELLEETDKKEETLFVKEKELCLN